MRVVLLLMLAVETTAQNIVPNPGFEKYEHCPNVFMQPNDSSIVTGWYSPTLATPDYFNTCGGPLTNVPNNAAGVAEAHAGKAYMGLAMYVNTTGNYSEYLQTKLLLPMVKDSTYCLTLFYRLASYSMYGSNGMGMYLSNEAVRATHDELLEYPAQLVDSIEPAEGDALRWMKLQAIYKAKGGEQYLTIGCLKGMLKYPVCANVYLPQRKEHRNTAYYYIDDVSIVKLSPQNYYSCFDTSLKFK
ncbi:MAG: hypothetical protein V4590_02325 [Bacteroidota bacterium]